MCPQLTPQNSQSELTREIVTALSSAVEAKDRCANDHSQRVAQDARGSADVPDGDWEIGQGRT